MGGVLAVGVLCGWGPSCECCVGGVLAVCCVGGVPAECVVWVDS